jgi:hypothetical protein
MVRSRFVFALAFAAFAAVHPWNAMGQELRELIENGQRVIPIESPLYRALEDLQLEAGRAPLSTAYPVTEAEARQTLDRLRPLVRSRAGLRTLAVAEAELTHSPVYREELFEADAGLTTALEAYLHTDNEYLEWEYGYEDRLPFLSVPLSAWFSNVLYLTSELTLNKEPTRVTEDPENITNVLTGMDALDITFPFRAFVSAGGVNWNFQFGRDTLSWGPGWTGNLLVSDYADYHEYLRFSAWGERFKFTSLYLNLEPWLKPGESAPGGDAHERSKVFIVNRFELGFLRKISFALSQGIMIGGIRPDIRALNPLMVYHNLYLESTGGYNLRDWANAVFAAELTVTPIRGFSAYGAFVLDQFQTSYEKDKWNAVTIPDAWGVQLGAEGLLPVGEGYLTGRAEWVYTTPWLYIRENPLVSFSTRRLFIANSGGGRRLLTDKPIGYEAGPDSITAAAGIEYRVPGLYLGGLRYRYLLSGENTLSSPYAHSEANAAIRTPSGDTPETKHVISLYGEITPLRRLTGGAELSFVRAENAAHVPGAAVSDLQLAVFVRYGL